MSWLTKDLNLSLVGARQIEEFTLLWVQEPLWYHRVEVRDDDGPLMHQVDQVGDEITISDTVVLKPTK